MRSLILIQKDGFIRLPIKFLSYREENGGLRFPFLTLAGANSAMILATTVAFSKCQGAE